MKAKTFTAALHDAIYARFTRALNRGNFVYADKLTRPLAYLSARSARAENVKHERDARTAGAIEPHELCGYNEHY